jgi:hypothetical protein
VMPEAMPELARAVFLQSNANDNEERSSNQ